MLSAIWHADNPLVKYGFSSVIVFGTLYILDSFGVSGAYLVAVIILILVLIRFVGDNHASFR